MNIDVTSDDNAETHWYVGHGKLDAADEAAQEVLTKFFEQGGSLDKAVRIVMGKKRDGELDWELAEMLMLMISCWVKNRKEKQ